MKGKNWSCYVIAHSALLFGVDIASLLMLYYSIFFII